MKQSEYEPAEAVEITRADDIILGWKDMPEVDCTGNPPMDRYCVEEIRIGGSNEKE